MTDFDMPMPPPPAGEPVPVGPPHNKVVLGRRVGAALIDLAILTALFVALAATIGEFDPTGGIVYLEGAPALLFYALVFLYYFAFEAATRRTVGKMLVGLQVADVHGRHLSAGRVALRTVLRAVDGLPLFYVVGFVVMLASGKRRQRLGDLAAGTIVVRAAAPSRHRGLAAAALVVALLAGVTAPAVAAGGTSATYQANGVTFQYPAGWRDTTPTDMRDNPERRWMTVLAASDVDGADIRAYTLSNPVTEEHLDAIKAETTPFFQREYKDRGGTMREGPVETTLAGLPALRYHGDGVMDDGTHVEIAFIQAFDGNTEYLVNCRYTFARAAELQEGCAQIVDTFSLEPSSGYEATGT